MLAGPAFSVGPVITVALYGAGLAGLTGDIEQPEVQTTNTPAVVEMLMDCFKPKDDEDSAKEGKRKPKSKGKARCKAKVAAPETLPVQKPDSPAEMPDTNSSSSSD